MPLYILDENEMMAEAAYNDVPTPPEDTMSLYSVSSSDVIASGNRVLELLEKHRKEIRARMATRERSFKSMLLQGRTDNSDNKLLGRENKERALSSDDSSLASGPSLNRRGSNTLRESYVNSDLTPSRNSEGKKNKPQQKQQKQIGKNVPEPFPFNPPVISSDEYLDLPDSFYESNCPQISDMPSPFHNGNTKSRRETTMNGRRRSRSLMDDLRASSNKEYMKGTHPNPRNRSSRTIHRGAEEDCIYVPDEDQPTKGNSSDSDCQEAQDYQTNLVNDHNNNRVTFNSQVMCKTLHSNSDSTSYASLKQSPTHSCSEYQDDHQDDEERDGHDREEDFITINDANRNFVDPTDEDNLADDDENDGATTGRGRSSMGPADRHGSVRPPRTGESGSDESLASSEEEYKRTGSDGGGGGIFGWLGEHWWQIIVFLLILLVAIVPVMYYMDKKKKGGGSSSYSSGSSSSGGGYPKSYGYYGPVM